MQSYPFKKIDAFASVTFSGNPAASVSLDSFDASTDAEMLLIARELKGCVSAVGDLVHLVPDTFWLGYLRREGGGVLRPRHPRQDPEAMLGSSRAKQVIHCGSWACKP